MFKAPSILLIFLPLISMAGWGRFTPVKRPVTSQVVTEGRFCNGQTQIAWYCGGYPHGEAWQPQGNMCFHRDTLLPCEKGSNDITLGKIINYGMSRGCPLGSFSATPSPDNKEISVLFNAYNLTYDAKTQIWMDPFYYNRDCSFLIPVKIPKNYQISIDSADFRGFVSVPQGGKFSFWSALKYSKSLDEWVDNRQAWTDIKHDLVGPLADQFDYQLEESTKTWSDCGEDLYIWISSGFNLFSNAQMDEVNATVDSLDIQMNPGVNVNLEVRRCQ